MASQPVDWINAVTIPYILSLAVGIPLSVITSIGVANILTHRELIRKAFDEMRFLRRRIFPKTGDADWDDKIVLFNWEMNIIIEELSWRGFGSSGAKIQLLMIEIFSFANETLQSSYREVTSLCNRRQIAPDRRDSELDAIMRPKVRDFLDKNLKRLSSTILELKPPLFEIIDAPTFLKWQRACESRFNILRRGRSTSFRYHLEFGGRRSDCGDCCDNCNRTV